MVGISPNKNLPQLPMPRARQTRHSRANYQLIGHSLNSDPTSVMESRVKANLSDTIPRIDFQDTLPLLNATRRQTAPEYSQSCYKTLLDQEVVVGNYFEKSIAANKKPLISIKERKRMIVLIETLQQMKNYKDDTFFLAVSLADRYFACLTDQEDAKPPCRVILAVTCLLIAAKIE